MATTEETVAAGLDEFAGEVFRPGDEGYDAARRVHNGMIDKRPALVARCRGVADVVAALKAARDRGLRVAVRGGGHGVAGAAVPEGGLMIDLSPMRGIHVDPNRRTVRAQGGVTWGELNRETQLHGLATTGGTVSTTGIAGLTLGGGLGWMMSKYGLATDNLVSAEVVTADGRVLTATATENAELFWAIRGGGAAFGAVTSFEYTLHPVGPVVLGGIVVHPFDAAADLLRFFGELATDRPEELAAFVGMFHAPDGSEAKLAALAVAHIGPPEQAEADVERIRAFGSPLDVQLGSMPYTAANELFDAMFPEGARNYWKSTFLDGLDDAAIETLVEQFATCPSPRSIVGIEHVTGAVTRVPADATAVAFRQAGFSLLLASVWDDPAADDANVGWTREAFAAMQPFAADRRYVNYYSDDDAGETSGRAAHGPHYDRLTELKARYDPENLFVSATLAPE